MTFEVIDERLADATRCILAEDVPRQCELGTYCHSSCNDHDLLLHMKYVYVLIYDDTLSCRVDY